MAKTRYKVMLAVSLLSILHSVFSAAQHRVFLRLTEQQFHSLPLDIVIQVLFSLAMAAYAVVQTADQFTEIRANVQLQNRSWETMRNRASFMVFSHRGRYLAPLIRTASSVS